MRESYPVQTSIRLPRGLLERLDALTARAKKRAGSGVRMDRSDLMRDILERYVANAEKRKDGRGTP